MKLHLHTSMVFDALCACALVEDHGNCNKVAQRDILERLKERTNGIFKNGALSFSTMCGIISQYLPNPENASLDDLYDAFLNIDKVDKAVRSKTTNEFTASYVFPTLDILEKEWAEKYREYIIALENAGFEELWREKALPLEQERMRELSCSLEDERIDSVSSIVSRLKAGPCKDVTVYISLLSYPVSFALHENAFLDTICDGGDEYFKTGFLSMLAHELMHGFASEKLVSLYKSFINGSRYLRSTHDCLIKDQHSGDEEEFVMAAEYYIMWRAGIMTKQEIVLKNCGRYGGCVPLALYIFEFMTREKGEISDYKKWLEDRFENGSFKVRDIITTIESLLPDPDNSDGFYATLFTMLQYCAYVIRDAQISFTKDIKPNIERLAGCCFAPNTDLTVRFAKGEKTLRADNARRETLSEIGLTIDAVTFNDKKSALAFTFPYCGSNVAAFRLDYNGERFDRPYILNLAHPKDAPMRVEFSFVCGSTRYLITSICPEDETNIDDATGGEDGYRMHGKEIIQAAKKASDVIMLLNDNLNLKI